MLLTNEQAGSHALCVQALPEAAAFLPLLWREEPADSVYVVAAGQEGKPVLFGWFTAWWCRSPSGIADHVHMQGLLGSR